MQRPQLQVEKRIPFSHSPVVENYLKDSHAREWMEYMIQVNKSPEEQERLGEYIRRIEAGRNKIPVEKMPAVQWVEDPGITNILGEQLRFPVMVYTRENIDVFTKIEGGLMQGVARHVVVGACPNKPFRYVALPSAEFDDQLPMSFEQRRRHELTHLIDPQDDNRDGIDATILSEIVALAGELSAPDADPIPVAVWDGYFRNYLIENKKLAHSVQTDKDIILWLIVKTSSIKNSQFVRACMFQKSNPELVAMIRKTPKRRLEEVKDLLTSL